MSILLILSMILTMSACNKETGESSTDSKDNSSESSNAIQTVAQETGYGYVSTYSDLPGDFDSVYNMSTHNGKLYFEAYTYDKVTYEGESFLASCNFDGSDMTRISLPETELDSSMNNYALDNDGNMWFLMYEYYYPGMYEDDLDSGYGVSPADEAEVTEEAAIEEPVEEADAEVVSNEMTTEEVALAVAAGDYSSFTEGENYEAYVLYKCDTNGNVLFKKNLSEDFKSEEDEYIYFYNLVVDNEGYCYLLQDTNLYVLDPNGDLSFKLTTTNWFDSVACTANGDVICSSYGDNGREVCKVDKANKDFGEAVELGDGAYANYDLMNGGASGYDLLLNDYNVLYGFSIETGEKTPILNWLDCDINGNSINSFFAVDENTFITMSYDSTSDKQMMVTMTRTPYDQIPVRTIITYAFTDYLNYQTRNAILNFNRQNQTYRVTTLDYSVYSTDDDYTAGATKLNNDILAGKIPDIIECSTGIDVSNLAKKGVLMDIYELIDADSEFSRDSFVSGALKAQEIDGKLYTIANSFSVQTAIGLTDVVGADPGWTFDDMIAAYETLPEGASIMRYMTKESFMNTCLSMAYSNYIDSETGECHFDSEDFVKLLEMANTFPADYDYYDSDEEYVDEHQLLAEGKNLIVSEYLYGFSDFGYRRTYLQGKDYTFVGFPCSSENGHIINLTGQMAVSAKSSSSDGVWEFMKTMLGEDFQTNNVWSFPVNQAALEKQMAEAMERPHYTDENGEIVYYDNIMYVNDQEVIIDPLTQEDVDKIMNVINNVSGVYTSNETVSSIISEEAASFFDGQKTAQDVANLIQNRVQTYIMEQR